MFCPTCIPYPTFPTSPNDLFKPETTPENCQELATTIENNLKTSEERIQEIQLTTFKACTSSSISCSVFYCLGALIPSNFLGISLTTLGLGCASGAVATSSGQKCFHNGEMLAWNKTIQLFNEQLKSFMEDPQDVKVARVFDSLKGVKVAWNMVNWSLNQKLPLIFKDKSDYFLLMELLYAGFKAKGKSTDVTKNWEALKSTEFSTINQNLVEEDYNKFWNAIGLWESIGEEPPSLQKHLDHLIKYENTPLIYLPSIITNVFTETIATQYHTASEVTHLLSDND